MYGDQRHYIPHFRQGPSALPPPPPPPFRQGSPGLSSAPPFLQPPSAPQHQIQPYFVPVNSNQPYLQPLIQAPPPPPPSQQIQTSGNASYPVAGRPVPMQLPPPPPRVFHPTPQLNPQPHGQVLYPNVHPSLQPPWPTNMPNPNFNWTVPTPFPGKNLTAEAHPPVIPPPPPPPPPSSPPPIPPSPPDSSDGAPVDFLKVSTASSKVYSEVLDFDSNKDCTDSIVTPKNSPLSPVLPEEDVVQSIKAFCELIVKFGPEYEDTARVKEVGNPQFEFLFGGEPGSVAAIGQEYFLWMKKISAKRETLKDHDIESVSVIRDDNSSQLENLEHAGVVHSPAVSDMDMEDDISPTDISKGFNNTIKESVNSIRLEIPVASEACSPFDAEDAKESSVFEDVSPERRLPDFASPGESVHEPTSPADDSFPAKMSTDSVGIESQVPDGVLKYVSPFRLLQDYASDESDENVKNDNGEDLKPESPSPASSDSAHHSPLILPGDCRSPRKSAPSISSNEFDSIHKIVDPSIIEKMPSDGRETSIPFLKSDTLDEKEMNVDHAAEFSLLGKPSPSSPEVDEFGRLIRKGVPGSDSDESRCDEEDRKRENWSRSRSRSLSASPQGSRRRRQSRSPWRRDKRSRSHSRCRSLSRSPKRARSRSPPSFRTNMPARQSHHGVPQECFNFNRGRCLYGTSCRFLHHDFNLHMSKQQRVQDLRKPRYSDRRNDSFPARIDRRESVELIEESNYKQQANKDPSDVSLRDNSSDLQKPRYSDRCDDSLSARVGHRESVELIEESNYKQLANKDLPDVSLRDSSIERESTRLPLDHAESSQDRSLSNKDQPDAQTSGMQQNLTSQIDNDLNIAAEATRSKNFAAHSFSHSIASSKPLPPPPPHRPNLSQFSSLEHMVPSSFSSAHNTNMPYQPRPFSTGQLPSSSELQPSRPPFFSFEHSQLHHQQHATQLNNDFSSSVFYPQAFNFMPPSYPHSGIHLHNPQNTVPHNPQNTVHLAASNATIHPSIMPADVSLSRFSVREHFNPFAATFEQPLREANIFRPNTVPIIGLRPEFTVERIFSKSLESSSGMTLDSKKQLAVGAQYDPLFDSIEPIPNVPNLRSEEPLPGVNDPSKSSSRKKVEVDELGEVVATDADAGGVENESPQLVDKEWSPPMPFDEGDTNVGEIEVTQVRTPIKSKKNKESRSVRLFKIALAEFAKDVLKPSWRQGNLSKEAFKTIVKKTVDKVSGAVPSHQIPKSQAKINQYVESSQRKLTKLVLGYVDKYVKM